MALPRPHPRPRIRRGLSSVTWRWRVVDIVVASVIGVACSARLPALEHRLRGAERAARRRCCPGLQGLLDGPWLFAGVLGAPHHPQAGRRAVHRARRRRRLGARRQHSGAPSSRSRPGSSRASAPSWSSCCSSTPLALPGRDPRRGGRGARVRHQQPHPLVRRRRHAVHDRLPRQHDDLGRRHRRRRLSWLLARGLAATGALDRFASGREARAARLSA